MFFFVSTDTAVHFHLSKCIYDGKLLSAIQDIYIMHTVYISLRTDIQVEQEREHTRTTDIQYDVCQIGNILE